MQRKRAAFRPFFFSIQLSVFRLLLHEKLHDNLCGVGDGCAGTEDGSNTGFVEENFVPVSADSLRAKIIVRGFAEIRRRSPAHCDR